MSLELIGCRSPGDLRHCSRGWACNEVKTGDQQIRTRVLLVHWTNREDGERFEDPDQPSIYADGRRAEPDVYVKRFLCPLGLLESRGLVQEVVRVDLKRWAPEVFVAPTGQ